MNAVRAFMRKEDYQPRRTPVDSPLRQFDCKCLRCDSYKLKFHTEFNEQDGEQIVLLVCTKCQQREKLPL
jgi:hypothetical protein